MEKLANVLEVLAGKLGTTVDKLWSVLIKQATISGIIDLIIYTLIITTSIYFFWLINKKTERNSDGRAEWDEDNWVVFGIGVIIGSGIIICKAETTVTAFLNPEYWALMKILGSCK